MSNQSLHMDAANCAAPVNSNVSGTRIMQEEMLQFVKDFIESHDAIGTKLSTRFPFRKLYAHCLRCAHWPRRLAMAEGADVEVAEVSALFHDIGKSVDNTVKGHAEAGARVCDDYLAATDFEDSKREHTVSIVRDQYSSCAWRRSLP